MRNTFIGQWWWSVDRFSFVIILIMIAFSAFMVATASPAVAERIGLESFFFIRKQIVYLSVALVTLFVISTFSPKNIKLLGATGFATGILLMVAVLFVGTEVKGATRWISLGGFSMQPSEFIKPFFTVIVAWILSKKYEHEHFPAFTTTTFIYFTLVVLLLLQPDLGMTVTITIIWIGQMFVAGLSIVWLIASGMGGLLLVGLSYLFLPHVTKRIDNYLNPEASENYQVTRSLEAFMNGGLYGTGPGEGLVKQHIPDSHTDFIFAVVGEELGLLTCIIIISLYATIVVRGFINLTNESDKFSAFTITGLLIQFGTQSMINMGVTLNLLPTKGMTLPFISYGGSSMISVAIAIGILLALSKRKFGSHLYHKIRRTSYKLRELQ
ncbi:MAG: cell division protein FtsW [Alphaproteobacteria bacterium 33-17]|nr:MAG: cell division protein FtsW [Alphaproteobacteria bacterium 33-17]